MGNYISTWYAAAPTPVEPAPAAEPVEASKTIEEQKPAEQVIEQKATEEQKPVEQVIEEQKATEKPKEPKARHKHHRK